MAYIGTSALAKKLGIRCLRLYTLIRRGAVPVPAKAHGRYLWSEQDVLAVIRVLDAVHNTGVAGDESFGPGDQRYYGSKAKWASFLRRVAEARCPGFQTFADLFAGMGSVAAAFSDKALIVNDLLEAAHVFLQAWFLPLPADISKIARLIDTYNACVPRQENYVSENFGGTYCSKETARKIGYVREAIAAERAQGQINAREEAALLVSLLHAMDKAANIYFHYDTYKKTPPAWPAFRLRVPRLGQNNPANRVFHTDANMLAPFIYADVVYLDPPGDSRQYCDLYHLLDTIAKWEKPEVFGTAGKPDRTHLKSLYCRKEAPAAYASLVGSVRSKLILASLPDKQVARGKRSAPRITTKEILTILAKKGEVRVVFPPLPKKREVCKETHLLFPDTFSHKTIPPKWKNHVDGGIAVCATGKSGLPPVDSPINFTGGKFRLLEQILPYFPACHGRFFDVFAGGCSVGINAGAAHTVCVDADAAVMGLFSTIRACRKEEFFSAILDVIQQNGLSLTLCRGYDAYGVTGEEGLAGINRAAYRRIRQKFNAKTIRDIEYWALLYVLIAYGYNNMPRFNAAGKFNVPVGKRDFNASMARKLDSFTNRIQSMDVQFVAKDFRDIDPLQFKPADFLFLDPPYMGAGAYYNANRGWRAKDEEDLMLLVSRLDARSIPFALFGALSFEKTQNTILQSWLSQSSAPHRIVPIRAENARAVLILNY